MNLNLTEHGSRKAAKRNPALFRSFHFFSFLLNEQVHKALIKNPSQTRVVFETDFLLSKLPGITVPARIESENVLIEHALKQPDSVCRSS
jgi:hypothetical protein